MADVLKDNVTVPGFAADLAESRKKNSPPLTWIAVPFVVAEDPAVPLAPRPALDEDGACNERRDKPGLFQ